MIVDAHVHIVAPDPERYPVSSAPGFQSREHGQWYQDFPVSAEDLLADIATAAVDKVVLVQPFSLYAFDNSYHADSAAKYPDRFVAVGALDLVAGDSPQQLAYWTHERRMWGVRLSAGDAGFDDPRAIPLWEEIASLGIPVLLVGGGKQIRQIRDVAARFPSVRLILDHGGGIGAGQDPAAVEDLLGLAASPNIFVKISTLNLGPLTAFGADGLEPWKNVVRSFGAERLLWGTNYPNSHDGTYADMVELGKKSLPFLSERERDSFLAGTARALWPRLE